MEKLEHGTAYNVEDFLNGSVEPQLRKGFNFNIDRVRDAQNNASVEVWISNDAGDTIEAKTGLKSDIEILEAIDYLGRKYE